MHKLLKSNSVAKKLPTDTLDILLSICEGMWQGIVVSGVLVVSAYLVKIATNFFFA